MPRAAKGPLPPEFLATLLRFYGALPFLFSGFKMAGDTKILRHHLITLPLFQMGTLTPREEIGWIKFIHPVVQIIFFFKIF